MKATVTEQNTTNNFVFEVEIETEHYKVTIWTNQKGKFIDNVIENKKDSELPISDELEEKILDYISDKWSSLISE